MTVKEGATGQVRVRVYLRTAIETSVGLDSALRAPVEPAPQATGGRGQAATVEKPVADHASSMRSPSLYRLGTFRRA